MASGDFTFPTANKYITGKIVWSSESNGSTANSSNVTVKLYYKKSSSSSSATTGTLKGKLFIDGTGYSYSKSITLSTNNTYKLIATKTVEIKHNSDGKKSIVIDATGGMSGTSFTSSNCPATTITLDVIPRYAITTIGLMSAAQTTITIPWSSDTTLNSLKIYVNGTLNKTVAVSTTSGTVTVSGLSPNTTYTIKLQGQRKDSLLWQYSDAETITTQSIASISSDVSFTIGEDLILYFDNYDSKSFYLVLCVLNKSNEWEQILSTDTMKVENYTWNLSSYTELLYSKVISSNSANIRIHCYTETSVNELSSIYKDGVMSINILENLPFAPIVSCENMDSLSLNVLEDNTYIPTNRTGMALKINTLAIAKNGASITKYIVNITNPTGVIIKSEILTSVFSAPYILDLGYFTMPGVHTLTIYAVDSRENKSDEINSSFEVLNYNMPRASISLARENNFERKTFFNFVTTHSNLKVDNIIKNTGFVIEYGYCAVGESFNGYTTISASELIFTDKGEYTETTLSVPIELDLDQKKSYNVLVRISDSLIFDDASTQDDEAVVYVELVGQGIPIMAQMDTGHVSVGMVPDINSNALLQVGSDIIATDSDGVKVNLLEFLNQVLSQELAAYKLQKIN